MTTQPLTPDQSVRLVFASYLKPRDSFSQWPDSTRFSVDLDLAENQILQVGIATYLDSEEDSFPLSIALTLKIASLASAVRPVVRRSLELRGNPQATGLTWSVRDPHYAPPDSA